MTTAPIKLTPELYWQLRYDARTVWLFAESRGLQPDALEIAIFTAERWGWHTAVSVAEHTYIVERLETDLQRCHDATQSREVADLSDAERIALAHLRRWGPLSTAPRGSTVADLESLARRGLARETVGADTFGVECRVFEYAQSGDRGRPVVAAKLTPGCETCETGGVQCSDCAAEDRDARQTLLDEAEQLGCELANAQGTKSAIDRGIITTDALVEQFERALLAAVEL